MEHSGVSARTWTCSDASPGPTNFRVLPPWSGRLLHRRRILRKVNYGGTALPSKGAQGDVEDASHVYASSKARDGSRRDHAGPANGEWCPRCSAWQLLDTTEGLLAARSAGRQSAPRPRVEWCHRSEGLHWEVKGFAAPPSKGAFGVRRGKMGTGKIRLWGIEENF